MKVCVLSESSADEAVIRIFAEGLLGRETSTVPAQGVRDRGWPSVRNVFPAVYKHVWYQTDADGLVLVVDSNGSPTHASAHDAQPDERCRYCELRRIQQRVASELKPMPGRGPLNVALGIATPAIEAWLAVRLAPQVTESAWMRALAANQSMSGYDKRGLKRLVYGTDRPSLQLATERGSQLARELIGHIDEMIDRFPVGFGALAVDLRSW